MARIRREFIKTTAAAGAMFGAVGEPKIGLIIASPRNHAPWTRCPSRFPRKSVSALSFLS
jgi:hypothetical protein